MVERRAQRGETRARTTRLPLQATPSRSWCFGRSATLQLVRTGVRSTVSGQADSRGLTMTPRSGKRSLNLRRGARRPAKLAGRWRHRRSYRPCQWRRHASGGRIRDMPMFLALRRVIPVWSAVHGRPCLGSPPRVRPNPSLERRPASLVASARTLDGTTRTPACSSSAFGWRGSRPPR